MNVTKPWLSKTIWLNAIGGVLAALVLFFPQAGVVSAWINANAAVVGIVWSILNMGLRLVTKNAISLAD